MTDKKYRTPSTKISEIVDGVPFFKGSQKPQRPSDRPLMCYQATGMAISP